MICRVDHWEKENEGPGSGAFKLQGPDISWKSVALSQRTHNRLPVILVNMKFYGLYSLYLLCLDIVESYPHAGAGFFERKGDFSSCQEADQYGDIRGNQQRSSVFKTCI